MSRQTQCGAVWMGERTHSSSASNDAHRSVQALKPPRASRAAVRRTARPFFFKPFLAYVFAAGSHLCPDAPPRTRRRPEGWRVRVRAHLASTSDEVVPEQCRGWTRHRTRRTLPARSKYREHGRRRLRASVRACVRVRVSSWHLSWVPHVTRDAVLR